MEFLKDRNKTALIANGEEITYRQLLDSVGRYTAIFNVPAGSRIALYAENRVEWVYAFFAAWHVGAIVVPVDHLLPADDVAYILGDCEPSVLICTNATRENAEAAIRQGCRRCALLNLDNLPAAEAQAPVVESVCGEANTTAALLYTSGTTGSPKGVMLSFGNLMVNLEAVISAGYFAPDQRVLVMLPLHHILPLAGTLLAPLRNGATLVFTPSLSPTDIIETLQRYAVTTLIGVPRFYSLITGNIRSKIDQSKIASLLFKLAGRIRSRSFSRLLFKSVHKKFGGHMEYMISGGAPLDPAASECLTTLGFNIYEGYGMTETAPIITFPRPDAPRAGSCGKPLEINEIRIVDGEILTRGPNVMQGYYNRPQETAETVQNGWLHTGDLGYLDNDGYLFITGRKKDILVLPNGKNINPQEIEEKLLAARSEVAEAAVYMRHNTIRALIRFNPDFVKDKTPGDLPEFLQSRILAPYNATAAPYKRISGARVVHEELPRTRLGKIQRFKLQELDDQAATGESRQKPSSPEPTTKTYRRIKQFISCLVPVPVEADSSLSDELGIDSLARVSLQAYLKETYGVELGERDFSVLATPRLLAERVEHAKSKDSETAISWKDILAERPPMKLPASSGIHAFIIVLSRMLLRLLFRFTIRGAEHLPKAPCILVANHQSYIDGLFVGAALTVSNMRNTYFYAKAEHVRKPLFRYLAENCNIITVDINSRLMESIQKMAVVLKEGHNIIIFPEGTRTQDGQMSDFRPTFAILSSELNIPVVPVAIDGAFKAMPTGKRIPRFFTRVALTVLPPVQPGDLDYDSLSDEVRERIMSVLQNRAFD